MLKFLKCFFAAHSADDGEVENHGVVGALNLEAAAVEREGFFAVAGDVEFVFEAGEHRAGEFPDFGIVIHEEHAAGSEFEGWNAAGFDFSGAFGFGEIDGECGAVSGFGLDGDLAVVIADDGVDGGKAEAGSGGFGGEKGFENAVEIGGRNSFAGIAHGDFDVISGGETVDFGVAEGLVFRLDLKQAGRIFHCLDAVDDQVLENLVHPAGVDEDGMQIGSDVQSEFRFRSGGGEAGGVAEEVSGIEGLSSGFAAAGKGEELAGERFGGEAGFFAVFERFPIAGFPGQRDSADDGGEQVVEIMGDASGEESERFHPVAFHQFLGRERHLVGIAENEGGSEKALVGLKRNAGQNERAGIGGFRFIDGEIAAEKDRGSGRENVVDQNAGSFAVLQARDREGIGRREIGWIAAGNSEKAHRLRVHEADRGLIVGDDDAFVGDVEGGLQCFGRQGGLPGDGRFVRFHLQAENAGEFAAAVEDADDVGVEVEKTSVGGRQAEIADEDGAAARIGEKGFERLPGRCPLEEIGKRALGFAGIPVAEPLEQCWRKEDGPVLEVEIEERDFSAMQQGEKSVLVLQAFLLQFLSFGNVEVESGNAEKFAGVAEFLDSGGLHPDVVAAFVAQAEFDLKRIYFSGISVVGAVGRRFGIFRMDEFDEGFVAVGEFVVAVAQQRFPAAGETELVGLEIEEEHSEVIRLGQSLPGEGGGGRGGFGWIVVGGWGRGRRGLRSFGRFDVSDQELGAGAAHRFQFEFYRKEDVGFGFGVERLRGFERGVTEEFPLDLPVLFRIGQDFQLKQVEKKPVFQREAGRVPKATGRVVAGRDVAAGGNGKNRCQFTKWILEVFRAKVVDFGSQCDGLGDSGKAFRRIDKFVTHGRVSSAEPRRGQIGTIHAKPQTFLGADKMKRNTRKIFFIFLTILLPLTTFGQTPAPEETHRAKQRVALEQIHARELARLNAIKKVAEQRESEELKKEVDELIADAKARHESALKTLEEPKAEEASAEEEGA